MVPQTSWQGGEATYLGYPSPEFTRGSCYSSCSKVALYSDCIGEEEVEEDDGFGVLVYTIGQRLGRVGCIP